MRRTSLALGVLLVLATSPGCSQVAQLKGVAGGQVSAVRAATNDVLVDEKVAVGVAPVCTFEDPLFVCRGGTTKDGKEISSQATVLAGYGETKDQWGAYVPADVSLVVTVDGAEIFNGKLEDVIAGNGQVTR